MLKHEKVDAESKPKASTNAVNIMFSDGILSTSVYRKPTFTGLFTNFDSFIPISYKKGFISLF